jgi:hypothetical protein
MCVKKRMKIWWKECEMSSNSEDIYRVGTKFEIFRIFFRFFRAITIKTTSFSIQTVTFIFKWSNLNLNRSIRRHHVTIVHQPQRRAIVQDGITTRPTQTVALPPDSSATSSYHSLEPAWLTVAQLNGAATSKSDSPLQSGTILLWFSYVSLSEPTTWEQL